jgi:ABC-type lipoprotein export system ATPase subunit
VVLVTHDAAVAAKADRVVHMLDGRVDASFTAAPGLHADGAEAAGAMSA